MCDLSASRFALACDNPLRPDEPRGRSRRRARRCACSHRAPDGADHPSERPAAGDAGRRGAQGRCRLGSQELLGALLGIAIAEGRIDPSATLAHSASTMWRPPSRTPINRQSVWICYARAQASITRRLHETADMRAKRPERGSHAAGTFWYYNNWDFNVLGTIYRQQTGEDIFASFAKRHCAAIGMEDFDAKDGRYVRVPQSRHEGYPFKLTARDAARFGAHPRSARSWGGRQIIPATWIPQSLYPSSDTDRGELGYDVLVVVARRAFRAGCGVRCRVWRAVHRGCCLRGGSWVVQMAVRAARRFGPYETLHALPVRDRRAVGGERGQSSAAIRTVTRAPARRR